MITALRQNSSYSTLASLLLGPDWVRNLRSGILSYLPGNSSIYDISKLHEQIKSVISPAIMSMGKELVLLQEAVQGMTTMTGCFTPLLNSHTEHFELNIFQSHIEQKLFYRTLANYMLRA